MLSSMEAAGHHPSDLSRARDYARLVERLGHAGLFASTSQAQLRLLRAALARVGATHEGMILEEAMTIDRASRDVEGVPMRDYLEIEEYALERLDRELFRQIPKLEARLVVVDAEITQSA